jgi:hypothetical protein
MDHRRREENAVTQVEVETELKSLRAEVALLRAQDRDRIKKSKSVVKMTSLIALLFAFTFLGFLVVSAWTGHRDEMLWAFPILFASISLSFVNQAAGVWGA